MRRVPLLNGNQLRSLTRSYRGKLEQNPPHTIPHKPQSQTPSESNKNLFSSLYEHAAKILVEHLLSKALNLLAGVIVFGGSGYVIYYYTRSFFRSRNDQVSDWVAGRIIDLCDAKDRLKEKLSNRAQTIMDTIQVGKTGVEERAAQVSAETKERLGKVSESVVSNIGSARDSLKTSAIDSTQAAKDKVLNGVEAASGAIRKCGTVVKDGIGSIGKARADTDQSENDDLKIKESSESDSNNNKLSKTVISVKQDVLSRWNSVLGKQDKPEK